MKLTLEYTLPEESEEAELAYKGRDYNMLITDLNEYLRRRVKYEEHKEEAYAKALEDVRAYIYELAAEYNVKL